MNKLFKFSYDTEFLQKFEIYIDLANRLCDTYTNESFKTMFEQFDFLFPKKYAYFMLKPDGARYFSEIIQLINDYFDSNTTKIHLFPVKDWEEFSKKIYANHFTTIPNFKNSFAAYCNATRNFFCNYSIVFLVEIETINYIEALEKVLSLKSIIRQKFMSKDFSIICNLDEENTVTHKLNLVHCPDPDISLVLKEFTILNNNRVFFEPINNTTFNNLIKYQTFNILKDIFYQYYF